MKFTTIYDKVLPLWGNNINFEDATTNDGSSMFTIENFISKKLEKKWDKIQESIPEEATYEDLMVWTLFQFFQEKAVSLMNQNINYFKLSSIDPKEVEAFYFENLQQESWEEELANYERA